MLSFVVAARLKAAPRFVWRVSVVAAFVSNAGGSNFYSDNGTTLLSTGVWATTLDGEVVPVPEPITWLAGALVFGALGSMQRRRLRAPLRRAG